MESFTTESNSNFRFSDREAGSTYKTSLNRFCCDVTAVSSSNARVSIS